MDAQIDVKLVAKDIPRAICFLKDIADVTTDMESAVKNVTKGVHEGEFESAKGLSFLDLKCHVMLSYLINMCHLVLRKCRGKSIQDDSSILRLVENRTVLEKLRPMEQKLKYHIDKLVKVSTGAVSNKDPLSYRANPQNLISKLGDDEDDDNEDSGSDVEGEDRPKKSKEEIKAYVPPKLASMPYNADDGNEMREKRQMDHARKRALSSTIMRELKAEFFEGPEEIRDRGETARKWETQDEKRKREYEEEYMTRLPVSKHEKKSRSSMVSLNGLTNFGDTSFLTANGEGGDLAIMQKKHKVAKKTKKRTKKGSKRFKKGRRK